MKMPSNARRMTPWAAPKYPPYTPVKKIATTELEAAVLDHPACAVRSRGGSAGGCTITRATASRMSTGTTLSNTELGSVSSSTPPVIPPINDAVPSNSTRRRWPTSSRR